MIAARNLDTQWLYRKDPQTAVYVRSATRQDADAKTYLQPCEATTASREISRKRSADDPECALAQISMPTKAGSISPYYFYAAMKRSHLMCGALQHYLQPSSSKGLFKLAMTPSRSPPASKQI